MAELIQGVNVPEPVLPASRVTVVALEYVVMEPPPDRLHLLDRFIYNVGLRTGERWSIVSLTTQRSSTHMRM